VNGVRQASALKNPSKLQAQPMPSALCNGLAASGKIALNVLREMLVAHKMLAEKIL
jgi:hypothetical protein